MGCKDIEINNLKIEKSKSKYGGAIYLSNSSIKISNSELSIVKLNYIIRKF